MIRFARIIESRIEYTGKILITRMPYYETLPLLPYKMIVTPTHIETEYIVLSKAYPSPGRLVPNSHAPASQIYDIYQNHTKEKNGLHK